MVVGDFCGKGKVNYLVYLMVCEIIQCNLNDLVLLNFLYLMLFVLQKEFFYFIWYLWYLVCYLYEIVGCVLFLVIKVRYCNYISRYDNCEYIGIVICLIYMNILL